MTRLFAFVAANASTLMTFENDAKASLGDGAVTRLFVFFAANVTTPVLVRVLRHDSDGEFMGLSHSGHPLVSWCGIALDLCVLYCMYCRQFFITISIVVGPLFYI